MKRKQEKRITKLKELGYKFSDESSEEDENEEEKEEEEE